MKKNNNHFTGCLLGGALGDALGTPVDTLSYKEITREYGLDGIMELQLGRRGWAEITNDTQLTLFTAEGLIRDKCRRNKKGIKKDLRETTAVIFRAYLRWLYTQGLRTSYWNDKDYDGWLVDVKSLYVTKEMDTTCMTTLGTGVMGRLSKPLNQSTTCGAVIRVAPIGLFSDNQAEAFELGKRVGAITHGHPNAYYSSAAMALLIYNIIDGMSIMDATNQVIKELKNHKDTQACVEKLELAVELYKSKHSSMQALTKLGSGKEAVESLGVGVYCALTYPDDIIKAIRLAVNHNGKSESTGSITGNIVGAYLGKDALPEDWTEKVQLSKEIEKIGTDLYTRHRSEDDWGSRYPSW